MLNLVLLHLYVVNSSTTKHKEIATIYSFDKSFPQLLCAFVVCKLISDSDFICLIHPAN